MWWQWMRRVRLAVCWVLIGVSPMGMAAQVSPPPIAIGFYLPVIRDVPRQDVEVSLRFWVDELAAAVNLSFKPIRFYDSMAELRRDMKSGEVNFMVATSMGVVQNFSLDELADGFSGLKDTPDHLFLVVRRSAGIVSLLDLIGKRVALLEGDELSEVYLETLAMKHWGKTGVSRLASISHEKRSSNLVHRLFFNQTDAALINRNAFEAAVAMNPQVGQQLQVLDAYTFKGRSPHIGLFSSRVAPKDIEAITQAAMRLKNSARGRQVLDIYHADSIVVTRVQDLAPFWDLLAQRSALKSNAVLPVKKRTP